MLCFRSHPDLAWGRYKCWSWLYFGRKAEASYCSEVRQNPEWHIPQSSMRHSIRHKLIQSQKPHSCLLLPKSLGQVAHSHCHGFVPSCLPDWLLCRFLKSLCFCVPEVRETLPVPAEMRSLLYPPFLDSGTPLAVSLLSLCFLMISHIFQVILLYREECA